MDICQKSGLVLQQMNNIKRSGKALRKMGVERNGNQIKHVDHACTHSNHQIGKGVLLMKCQKSNLTVLGMISFLVISY